MATGERMKEARQRAGLSQEVAAERIKVSRQTLSNWENGKTLPDSESILRMSRVYGITTDELLKNSQTEYTEKQMKAIASEAIKPIIIIGILNVLLSRIIVYLKGDMSNILIWLSVLLEFALVFTAEFRGIPSGSKAVSFLGRVLLKAAVVFYFALILVMSAVTFRLFKMGETYTALKMAAGTVITATAFYIVFIHRYIKN